MSIIFKESLLELLSDTCMPNETEEELIIIVGPEKKEEAKLPLEACTAEVYSSCLAPTETSYSFQDLAEMEQAVMPRSEPVAVFPLIELDEPVEEEEPEQEEAKETEEFGSSEEQPASETSASDEQALVLEIEANIEDETGK